MKKEIIKHNDIRKNAFGQYISSNEERYIYFGTIEEFEKAQKDSGSCPVIMKRNEKTEHLFPTWDKDAKYIESDGTLAHSTLEYDAYNLFEVI